MSPQASLAPSVCTRTTQLRVATAETRRPALPDTLLLAERLIEAMPLQGNPVGVRGESL